MREVMSRQVIDRTGEGIEISGFTAAHRGDPTL